MSSQEKIEVIMCRTQDEMLGRSPGYDDESRLAMCAMLEGIYRRNPQDSQELVSCVRNLPNEMDETGANHRAFKLLYESLLDQLGKETVTT